MKFTFPAVSTAEMIKSFPKMANLGFNESIAYPIDWKDFGNQLREIFEWEIYKPIKKRNNIIVDLGANCGMSAMYLAQYAKEVYCAEPVFNIFAALTMNTKQNPKIKRFRTAITSFEGNVMMFGPEGTLPQTVFEEKSSYPLSKKKKIKSIANPCTTLTKFLDYNKIDIVDVLKIDVEGAEYDIFMDPNFAKICHRIKCIVGETHHITTNAGFIPAMIEARLKDLGYSFKWIKTPLPNFEFQLATLYGDEEVKVTAKLYTNFRAVKL
jgi:FkbM family methyltransferase